MLETDRNICQWSSNGRLSGKTNRYRATRAHRIANSQWSGDRSLVSKHPRARENGLQLSLNNNRITDVGAIHIARIIAELKNTNIMIHLNGNTEITKIGALTIARALTGSNAMAKIQMKYIMFDEETIEELEDVSDNFNDDVDLDIEI